MNISLIIFLQHLRRIVCQFINKSKYFRHPTTTIIPKAHENKVKFFSTLN